MGALEVLLVDDDLCLARSMARQLSLRGIAATHCASVHSAMKIRRRFPVGIFDIDLPDGNGVSLAAQLLARGIVGRAIFNTGSADSRRLRDARRLGAVFQKTKTAPLVASLLGPSVAACAAPPADCVEFADTMQPAV